MKKIIFVIVALIFSGCDKPANNHFLTLDSVYLQLQTKQMLDSQDPGISKAKEEAMALIQRAQLYNYQLIDSRSLERAFDGFIVIATLPRGIYNLGLIPNAMHFEFTKSLSANTDGSEWNWKEDAKGQSKEKFLEFLGEDKNVKIVFYDEGEDIFAPAGSAHTAILWAQHEGYTNLYRLVGGFGAWKALGLKTTKEVPLCCQIGAHDSQTHHSGHTH